MFSFLSFVLFRDENESDQRPKFGKKERERERERESEETKRRTHKFEVSLVLETSRYKFRYTSIGAERKELIIKISFKHLHRPLLHFLCTSVRSTFV